MAEGKKSFIAYSDWKTIFDELPDEDAGKLIKHIFAYVNDENPKSDSILIRAVFATIKITLKRDLEKWEKTSLIRSESGRLGGLRSGETRQSKQYINEANEANASKLKQTRSKTKQNEHDSVSVSDSVNDNEKKKIVNFTPPKIEDVILYFQENGYKKESAIKAFDYYNVANWHDSKGNKIKNWKQKMQGVWFKPENKDALKETGQSIFVGVVADGFTVPKKVPRNKVDEWAKAWGYTNPKIVKEWN